MRYKEIKVDSLINKITKQDTLFGGKYTIDPYQNCEFGCKYCDSSLDKVIYIKTNSEKILSREINQIERDLIIVGSVHDPYQQAEQKYQITRKLLKIIQKNNFPCHILTKSNLVLRDIDILSKIKKCIVTISLISIKKSVASMFEKDVPTPDIRLHTIKKLSRLGISSGIAIMPILPYITEKEIKDIIKQAKNNGATHILYKHLELKGDQRILYLNILKKYYPELFDKYLRLYQNSYQPDDDYILKIKEEINILCKKNGLNSKI